MARLSAEHQSPDGRNHRNDGPAGRPKQSDCAAPPKKNNIQVKTILQAFREAEFRDPQNPDKATVVPASYVGEFQATAVTENSVTLKETMPLSPDQIAAGQLPGDVGPL